GEEPVACLAAQSALARGQVARIALHDVHGILEDRREEAPLASGRGGRRPPAAPGQGERRGRSQGGRGGGRGRGVGAARGHEPVVAGRPGGPTSHFVLDGTPHSRFWVSRGTAGSWVH